jgi:hypothetical protein
MRMGMFSTYPCNPYKSLLQGLFYSAIDFGYELVA